MREPSLSAAWANLKAVLRVEVERWAIPVLDALTRLIERIGGRR